MTNNIVDIGIKRIASHEPVIFFVDSIQIVNAASIMVQEENECIIHGMKRLKLVSQMRGTDVLSILVNIC